MNIQCRPFQPREVIAQRFVGRLGNKEAFTVDLWNERDTIVVVVGFPGGGTLESLDDLNRDDRDLVEDLIRRNARPLIRP